MNSLILNNSTCDIFGDETKFTNYLSLVTEYQMITAFYRVITVLEKIYTTLCFIPAV